MFECHSALCSLSNSNLLDLIHLTTENRLPLEISGRGHFFHIRCFNHCDRDCLQCLLLRKCHFPIFKSLLLYEDHTAADFLLLSFWWFFLHLRENHLVGGEKGGTGGVMFFTQRYIQAVTSTH